MALSLTLYSGVARAGSEVLEDFESEPQAKVENNSDSETRCAVSEDPGKAGNHVLKLSWAAHSGTHVAGSLSVPGAVVFREPGIYEVAVNVNLEQCPPDVRRMALRVVDARNEAFQYSVPVEHGGEPGWTVIKWTINTNDPLPGAVKSWGKEVDGTMDFPVRFYGFAMSLKDRKTTGGTVLFDEISVTRVSD